MDKNLKKLRVTISVLVLIITSWLFINIWSEPNLNLLDSILFLQFTPSLISFVRTMSLGALGFIIVIAFTLLIGRAYCSFICPLGITQDIISFLSKKIGIKKKFKYKKGFTVFSYIFLFTVTLLFAFNIVTLLSLFDPYSIFGRFMNNFILPLVTYLNNIIAAILNGMGIFSVFHIDIPKLKLSSLIISGVLFFTVFTFSLLRGRLWCNTFCPVGILLGIFSKKSLFKIRFYTESCTRCMKCAMVCKSECISVKTQTIDFSRCVDCFNCIDICEDNAIGFDKTKRIPLTVPVVDKEKREFVSQTAMWLTGLLFIPKLLKSSTIESEHKCRNEMGPSSPPGSVSLEHFNTTCTACHLCITACPTNVLRPSLLEYGLIGVLQPYMDFQNGFCNYDCTTCSDVCPTGAIINLDTLTKHETQIGEVKFFEDHCIVSTEGTACGSCSEHCPTQAVRMVPYKNGLTIPETEPEICVGCGACEYACPVIGKAIRVDGHKTHQKAQKPVTEKDEENSGAIEEFPF